MSNANYITQYFDSSLCPEVLTAINQYSFSSSGEHYGLVSQRRAETIAKACKIVGAKTREHVGRIYEILRTYCVEYCGETCERPCKYFYRAHYGELNWNDRELTAEEIARIY